MLSANIGIPYLWSMMLVTHASHFLSTQLIRTLNQNNFNYWVAADQSDTLSLPQDVRVQQQLTHEALSHWLNQRAAEVEYLFHLDSGDESDDSLFRWLWQQGTDHQIPFTFRTTAARSSWIEQQESAPFCWAGLSFQDAFGPGDNGWVPRILRSDGREDLLLPSSSEAQMMVYSKDVAAVCYHFVHHRTHSGTYSLDPSSDASYSSVAQWVAHAQSGSRPETTTVSPPPSLQAVGYKQPFFSLEAGVYDYVQNHLRG